jgi:hypothetical protein
MFRETEVALETAEEGLALFRKLQYQPGIAQALTIIGDIASFGGDDAHARRAYEESMVISQETGERWCIRFLCRSLAVLAQHAGEYQQAKVFAEQGLRLSLEMENRLDTADSLATLAGVLGATGHPERAASLLGASKVALEQMGAAPQPVAQADHERTIVAVRAQLDSKTFEAAWEEGRAMSLKQAVASALQ